LNVDFYLVSSEGPKWSPARCRIVSRLENEIRDDLALVELEAPLPDAIYDTKVDRRPTVDRQRLILASRRHHLSLFPITEWPTPIYVGLLKAAIAIDQQQVRSNAITIVDWGEIYQTREEAAAVYDRFVRDSVAAAARRAIVGSELRDWRLKKALTVAQLSQQSTVPEDEILAMESGPRTVPFATAWKLAEVLWVPLTQIGDDLFRFQHDTEPGDGSVDA
jgi:hypothetical protein